MQLFIRTHRGVTLTESGKSFYNDAKYLIRYSHDSLSRAREVMADTSNIIRIGTSPITPSEFLVELWPLLHEKCQDVKFKLVPFENTPENAREILRNLGQHIDIVSGLFDEKTAQIRECAVLELSKVPLCCAVSIHHRLAAKDRLKIEDLYGETLMLIRRDWNRYIDMLRDDLMQNHRQINILNFDFYNTNVFNKSENSDNLLLAVKSWSNVHPLLKVLPVEWEYTVPFGILHSPSPSKTVVKFLNAVQMVWSGGYATNK
jgi:DNA-binding transcriptional LysR family regulator